MKKIKKEEERKENEIEMNCLYVEILVEKVSVWLNIKLIQERIFVSIREYLRSILFCSYFRWRSGSMKGNSIEIY